MSGTNNTPYGTKGQWGYYTDGETGLLLLTHRYFDPATGRFLTRDPIGVEGGIKGQQYMVKWV
jgi:RHS repeat-associated protein